MYAWQAQIRSRFDFLTSVAKCRQILQNRAYESDALDGMQLF